MSTTRERTCLYCQSVRWIYRYIIVGPAWTAGDECVYVLCMSGCACPVQMCRVRRQSCVSHVCVDTLCVFKLMCFLSVFLLVLIQMCVRVCRGVCADVLVCVCGLEIIWSFITA